MTTPFQRAYPPARPEAGPALWLLFRNGEILVQEQTAGIALIVSDEAGMAHLKPYEPLYLGTLHGVPCLAREVSTEQVLPTGWRALALRALFGQVDEETYLLAGYASHLLHWQRESRYCPVCGQPLGAFIEQWSRHCSHCSYIGYPRISPAVLVLVYQGEQVLLAHQPGWGTRYSILAGFVEPGESLEGCVQREVAEEVGVTIADITYAGSQPWPFPQQLMIAFTARYVSGEICPDQQEIDHAAWFRFDQLPNVPPLSSLSGRLIRTWALSFQPEQQTHIG